MTGASGIADTIRYVAFLSYNHADRRAARRLQRQLEAYVLPRRMRIADGGRMSRVHPLRPIFRDEDEMIPGQGLSKRVRQALAQSEHLIVVCSPSAARSAWVEREILEFCELGKEDRILAVLVGGEPLPTRDATGSGNEALPRALCFHSRALEAADGKVFREITGEPAEPLWLDLRPGAPGRRRTFLRLAAALLSLPSFDDLVRRDVQARRQRLASAGLALVPALVLIGSLVGTVGSVALEDLDSGLEEQLTDLIGRTSFNADGEYESVQAPTQRHLEPYSGQYWQVQVLRSGKWQVVGRSRSLWDRELRIPTSISSARSDNGVRFDDMDVSERERVRIAARYVSTGPRYSLLFVVARDRENLVAKRLEAVRLLALAAAGYLCLFLGWKLWKRFFRK